MSGSNLGSILSGSAQLLQTVFGTSTDSQTHTSGSTATGGAEVSEVSKDETDNTGTITAGYNNTSSGTNTSTSTSASADPGVIATLKSLAATAIGNSTDPSKTTGLLSGILQSAGDAIGQIFGQQSQAGVYNSASTQAQSDNIQARASADAASAILGYQTSEQQIAGTALNQLLQATATSKSNTQTNNVSINNTGSTTATTTGVNSDTKSIDITKGGTSLSTGSSTSSSTSLSVVCTWMYANGMLDRKKYVMVSRDFAAKPWYIIQGYLATVHPLLMQMAKNRNSKVSKATLAVFRARTNWVCGEKTVGGWFARALVWVCCAPASIFYFMKGRNSHVSA